MFMDSLQLFSSRLKVLQCSVTLGATRHTNGQTYNIIITNYLFEVQMHYRNGQAKVSCLSETVDVLYLQKFTNQGQTAAICQQHELQVRNTHWIELD